MAAQRAELGPDGYPLNPADPYYESQLLLNTLLKAARRGKYGSLEVAEDHPSRKAVLLADARSRGDGLVACMQRLVWLARQKSGSVYQYPLRELLGALFSRRPTLEPRKLEDCFLTKEPDAEVFLNVISEADMVALAERSAEMHALPKRTQGAIRKYRQELHAIASNAGMRKLVARLDALLGEAPTTLIEAGEAWSDFALSELRAMSAKRRKAWEALLRQAAIHCPHRPSPDWLEAAAPLLEAVGHDAFTASLTTWAALVGKPGTKSLRLGQTDATDNTLLSDTNADILRGLIWCCPLTKSVSLDRMLVQLAEVCFEMLPGRGPRSPKIGFACVYALGELPGTEPVAQLSRMRVRIRNRLILQKVEEALQAVARKAGVTVDELAEMSVPAYGLEEVGVRREQLGDYTAELAVTGAGSTELRWKKADGSPQKSVPAAVKKEHAEDLKELQAAAKDIQKMLPAQRDRIDSLFLARKTWPFAKWRERYLDHPLVGALARRLIWRFGDGKTPAAGIWHDGQIVGADDKPLKKFADDMPVSLWHPLDEPTEAVLAWRAWLEKHEVRQPFKQAHREIYVLTDAERRTATYSNRYAAHLLKQHQFNALCGIRGWRNKLRLMVDAEFPPASRELPQWNLRAEFWIEGAGDEYGRDTNETGTFLYLTTDQVRFYRLGEEEWLRLEEVPPLVFSEIMRDADLFVGVASVGNDPNWADGGPEGRYRDYWQSYSFGDLSATAQTRKAVLERLVPRLKIAPRCSFSDKFLVVKGDLRAYKIHLGSGNILMAPNDQYLCIVAKQSAGVGTDRVFLPYDGDNTLAVILSKAFLLAEDAKIKDPSIVSQIKGR